jgi:uncharacterized protein YecT (DUF1311 family)
VEEYVRYLALLGLCLAIATPAIAEDNRYPPTDADDDAMTQCIEAQDAATDDPGYTDPIDERGCVGMAASACKQEPDASSTPGIAACNMREASWWTGLVGMYLASLEAELTPDQYKALVKSQELWQPFMEAKCAFVYEFWIDGTIRDPLHADCVLQETATRALELRDLLVNGHSLED